jgi:hypothetical protein
MLRREFPVPISGPHTIMASAPAFADSPGPQLASYDERHMALLDGVAYGNDSQIPINAAAARSRSFSSSPLPPPTISPPCSTR